MPARPIINAIKTPTKINIISANSATYIVGMFSMSYPELDTIA